MDALTGHVFMFVASFIVGYTTGATVALYYNEREMEQFTELVRELKQRLKSQ